LLDFYAVGITNINYSQMRCKNCFEWRVCKVSYGSCLCPFQEFSYLALWTDGNYWNN